MKFTSAFIICCFNNDMLFWIRIIQCVSDVYLHRGKYKCFVCRFVIVFNVCLFWFLCISYFKCVLIFFCFFFLLSCILLSVRALCLHAVALFANLMCLYLDTCVDILTCMCKVIFGILLFDKHSRNTF